jgi:hypothetical protein
MGAEYNGTTLLFGVSNNLSHFMISMADPSWSLPSDEQLSATIGIDEKGKQYKGLVVGPTQITFDFRPDANLVRHIATGKTLNVGTAKQSWRFNLVGTATAIPALLQCVAARTGDKNPFDAAPVTRNPFSS